MATVTYIALGSNLGDRLRQLQRAVGLLCDVITIDKMSNVYETHPVGVEDQPLYLNQVIRGTTDVPPAQLLQQIMTFETELGRTKTFPYGPRVIDIDLLLWGDVAMGTDRLVLPHPRMYQRGFVLWPLAEIEPTFKCPVTSFSMEEWLKSYPTMDGVWRYNPG